ncbi:hypothetical protein ACFXHD_02480 [Streptomyces hydrogenans]|uniref:hypothetical protein n=1 Tax=Streptomyces hydrogenans TaxID=1873719 RepID=UPI00369EA8A3
MDETTYYQLPDESVLAITCTGTTPAPQQGAMEMTEGEYETALAAIEAQREQDLATTRAAEAAAVRDDYEALLVAGIPETTAQRLTGYTPPQDGQNP